MELLAEREAEKQKTLQMIADSLPRAEETEPAIKTAAQVWAAGSTSTAIATTNGTLGSTPSDLAADTVTVPPPSTTSAPLTPPPLTGATPTMPSASFSSLLRARADRIDLRGWR